MFISYAVIGMICSIYSFAEELASVLGVHFFFITENWIFAMTTHHADPNINILLTRNAPFDFDVR